MANEDQPYNDHHLHIEGCPCGSPAPRLMGDDFDADVFCEKCQRSEDGYGTKGAIREWNQKVVAHNEKKTPFPRPLPDVEITLRDSKDALEEAAKNCEELGGFDELSTAIKKATGAIEEAQAILADMKKFQGSQKSPSPTNAGTHAQS